MRIKNGINPKFAEIGKVKIGEHSDKVISGHYMPTRLDHFRVVTTEKDRKKQNFLPDKEVMSAIGETPREISIVFAWDDPEMIFQTSYAYYAGRKCICRGDGEEATMEMQKDGKPSKFTLLDTGKLGDTVQKGEKRKIVCDHENCPFAKPDAKGIVKCKPNGRLIFIIPASKRLNGYYVFRTTSWNTISFITQALDEMKRQAGGVLAGVPAKMFFFKKATEGHGNVPVVTVDWNFDDIEKFRLAVVGENKMRLEFKRDMKLIETEAKASGVTIDTDDPEDVAKEFYPEQSVEFKKAQEDRVEKEKTISGRADSILDDIGPIEDADSEVVDDQETSPTARENTQTIEKAEREEDLDLFS